nr:MAG TPA: hypothetical protein [Caudoviricetes sp.]
MTIIITIILIYNIYFNKYIHLLDKNGGFTIFSKTPFDILIIHLLILNILLYYKYMLQLILLI